MTNTVANINTPIDMGKKTIDDIFNQNKKLLNTVTFISKAAISCNFDECNLPNQNKFLLQKWNKTFSVEKQKGKLQVKLLANFIVEDVRECTLVYNDKSNKKAHKYYVISLKNDKGAIERDVEVSNNSKSDVKQFETAVNNRYTGFQVCMSEAEFKTFVCEYVSPKVANNAIIYTNAGTLEPNKILYENALATKDGIIWADEKGYIKTGEKTYIKIAESTHYLPKLAKSDKTGKEIAKELIENIAECWSDDIALPMMTLGHMVMSIYYNEFVKRYGVPTLILFGETGTGKSTLVTVGLSIFGLTREALTSGGSTAKSNEYFCSKYNGMNVCIDDVKGETLASSNFTALVKGAYKGVPRTKMLPYGKGVEYINTCSPLAYSTNESLPDLKEVVNRMNIVEIFGKVFKADKFNYHEVDKGNNENLKELSLILPEFLKYSIQDVLDIYDTAFALIENANIQNAPKRIINNIAYAYTGIFLFLEISGVKIDNIEQKIVEYAKKQIEQYENIKTPVEKVLSAIITLTDLKQLEYGVHFKIADVEVNETLETHIKFNKDVVLSAINKFYAFDKSMQIDTDSFLRYAQNHNRFRGNNKSVRYDNNKNKVVSSICFDITGIGDFAHIAKNGVIMPTPINEIRANLETNSNNM